MFELDGFEGGDFAGPLGGVVLLGEGDDQLVAVVDVLQLEPVPEGRNHDLLVDRDDVVALFPHDDEALCNKRQKCGSIQMLTGVSHSKYIFDSSIRLYFLDQIMKHYWFHTRKT